MSGSGRCNGYGSQLWREPTVASFPFRQTFEPGLDSSLDCCLYRLGYESMCGYHPCEVAILRTVHNRSGHSCRILALMLAVDAHTTA